MSSRSVRTGRRPGAPKGRGTAGIQPDPEDIQEARRLVYALEKTRREEARIDGELRALAGHLADQNVSYPTIRALTGLSESTIRRALAVHLAEQETDTDSHAA